MNILVKLTSVDLKELVITGKKVDGLICQKDDLICLESELTSTEDFKDFKFSISMHFYRGYNVEVSATYKSNEVEVDYDIDQYDEVVEMLQKRANK